VADCFFGVEVKGGAGNIDKGTVGDQRTVNGIDTVALGGRGFTPLVKKGEKLRAGDALVRVDLDVLRNAGCPLSIPVLVTNPECLKEHTCKTSGRVKGGVDVVMQYRTT
jgi:phosphotransferase system IIA component